MLNCFSCILLFANLWTVACQAPLSIGFPRQQHWNGVPGPHPGGLHDPGIEPMSLMSHALAREFLTGKPKRKLCMRSHFSCVQFSAIPWTVALQALLSMGLSRQGYWKRLSFPPPGCLLDPVIKPASLLSGALAGGFFTSSAI